MRADIQAYVLAHPGQRLREIAAGIGLKDRASIATAGAQISQLVSTGKLRAELPDTRRVGALYYPTPTTGVSRRASTPEEAAARKLARAQRKNARRRAERQAKRQAAASRELPPAQRTTFYGEVPAPRPLPRSLGMTIARKALDAHKVRFDPSAKPESVEDWMRRTGQQPERLPPHACSKQILRFDYSNTRGAIGRRRPAIRTRTARTY